MSDKPLFLPLKREYFDAFEAGIKTHEYRVYGPRWNEKTCRIGRLVTLSCGYGKGRRMTGLVRSFDRVRASELSDEHQQALEALYGPGDHDIACIGIVRRVQIRRAKGWRMPENTVKVDRSTKWGNPFNTTQEYTCFPHKGYPMPLVELNTKPSLERCVDMFQAYLYGRLLDNPHLLDEIEGKNLACWCPPDQLCHADVLLRLANTWNQVPEVNQ